MCFAPRIVRFTDGRTIFGLVAGTLLIERDLEVFGHSLQELALALALGNDGDVSGARGQVCGNESLVEALDACAELCGQLGRLRRKKKEEERVTRRKTKSVV